MKRVPLSWCLCLLGCWSLSGCGEADDPGPGGSRTVPPDEPDPRPVVLFMGDSLTAGYQLDPADAYPALLQGKIDGLGWNYQCINAGVSGETTAAGLRRIPWLLKNPVSVLFLELGANDGLRGVPARSVKKSLQAILDKTWERYPDARIILAGMKSPPNMGPEYTAAFEAVFDELEQENDVVRVPFFLEGVATIPELNLPDGIHPNEAGHAVIAETVWKYLEPVLADLEATQS